MSQRCAAPTYKYGELQYNITIYHKHARERLGGLRLLWPSSRPVVGDCPWISLRRDGHLSGHLKLPFKWPVMTLRVARARSPCGNAWASACAYVPVLHYVYEGLTGHGTNAQDLLMRLDTNFGPSSALWPRLWGAGGPVTYITVLVDVWRALENKLLGCGSVLRRRFSKNRRNFEELFVENKTRKLHILKIAI